MYYVRQPVGNSYKYAIASPQPITEEQIEGESPRYYERKRVGAKQLYRYVRAVYTAAAPASVLSISQNLVQEGSTLTWLVTLTSASTGQTFTLGALGGTAASGTDYTLPLTFNNGVTLSGSDLTVPAGVSSFTASLATVNNSSDDGDRTVVLTIGGVSATGTILDEDVSAPMTPAVSITDGSANEVAGTVSFIVTISAAPASSVSVDYATSGGTAISGSDYTATSGTLTWGAGDGSPKVINVPISAADATGESPETFTVTLSNAAGCTIADGTGTGTIYDSGSFTSGMLLGMNENWVKEWDDQDAFINLARYMSKWKASNSVDNPPQVTFQKNGVVTVNPAISGKIIAYFHTRAKGFADPSYNGDYIIRAKGNGGSISVYDFNVGVITNKVSIGTLNSNWQTVCTFTYTANNAEHNNLTVEYNPNGTGTGITGLQIIKTSDLALYDTGCEWKQSYMDKLAALNVKVLRVMDMGYSGSNLERDWAHRVVPSDIMYNRTPYEVLFDLSTRTGIQLYLNVPHRASADYCAQLGSLINAHSLPTWIECVGNETWLLSNAGMVEGGNWCIDYGLPIYEGTINSDGSVYYPNHGYVNDQIFKVYNSSDDYAIGKARLSDYPLGRGVPCYVVVKDADNFWFKRMLTDTAPTMPAEYRTKMVWRPNTGGAGNDVGHARIFVDQATAILTTANRAKCKFILASQHGGVARTGYRLKALSAAELSLVDYVAIAPYTTGLAAGARIVSDGTNVTVGLLRMAASAAEPDFYWGIYLATATPSTADIMAGTGAIAAGTYITGSSGADNYVDQPPVAGLVNGTNYKLCVIAYHEQNLLDNPLDNKHYYPITVPFTMSASTQTVEGTMSIADKYTADLQNIAYQKGVLDAQAQEALGKPLIAYECGNHYYGLQEYRQSSRPFHNWLKAYMNSALYKDIMKRMFYMYAQRLQMAAYYKRRSITAFNLSNYIEGTSVREEALTEFGGVIPKYNEYPSLSTGITFSIPSVPSSFPHVLVNLVDGSGDNTLDSGAVTYEVLSSGNENGYFGIVGNNLVLTSAAAGIDYSKVINHDIMVLQKTPAFAVIHNLGGSTGTPANKSALLDILSNGVKAGAPTGNNDELTFTFTPATPYDNFMLDMHAPQPSRAGSPRMVGDVLAGETFTIRFKLKASVAGLDGGWQILNSPLVEVKSKTVVPKDTYGQESYITFRNDTGATIPASSVMNLIIQIWGTPNTTFTLSIKDVYKE